LYVKKKKEDHFRIFPTATTLTFIKY